MLVGRLVQRAEALLRVDVRLDRSHHALCDVILDCEEVAQLAVVSLGPDVLSRLRVDELRGHADAPAGGTHAAFEDVADAELLRDLPHVHGFSLVGEAGMRAITNSQRRRASAVMMSSEMPSER
jgi:hypothetical protein